MDQARIATIVGVTIGATTIADKLIERLWPSSRVNSILDVTLLLLRGVQGALAAEKTTRRSRKAPRGTQADERIEEDFPSAVDELLDVVHQERAAVAPPQIAPAADPAYWERPDIKAWAAAHPQLADALKRKYGLDRG